MSFGSDRPWRQQPEPGGAGAPPPGPPKPNRRGLKIAGGVVGFLIVVGIISAATSGGGKGGSAGSPEAPPATFDVTTTTPDVLPTTDDPLTDDPADVGPTDDTFDDPTTPETPETVTYIVSGSSADVTYGPAGSSLSGHSPMKVTKSLGDPAYYSITAQLHGGGHVSCKLEIDGEVISQAEAKGGYQIAMCEAVNVGGSWEDANGG